jgi:hypothetical protein
MKKYFIVFVIIAGAIVVAIFSAIHFCLGKPGCENCSGILGHAMVALVTALLVLVAWWQLRKLSKTNSADFIHKLATDFFTPEARRLMNLIDCEALEFDNKETRPYFKVNLCKLYRTNPREFWECLIKKKYYSTWEVDDFLLGHFEDIGRLVEDGIVEFQMVNKVFSSYIPKVWDYDHIQAYVMSERKRKEDKTFFKQFEDIAEKFKKYDGIKPGSCMWKFKRWWFRVIS